VLFSEFWCSGISDALEIKEKRRAALTRWPMSVRFFDFFFGDKRPIMTRLQSVRRDYKGELAVVIFRTGRHMTLDKSLGFVEEETSITDGTAYGYLKHIAQIAWGQKAVKSNSFDPWIMGMNEIHVAYGLELICRSNGKEIQHGSTGYSSFHFRRLSLYMSTWDTPRYGAIMPPKRLKAAVVNVSHEYGYVL
jgi:acylpyruvate hydrolase